MNRLRLAALISVASIVAAGDGMALAADDAAYERHRSEARKLVHKEDWSGAIKEFEAAYAASPKPEALYNIGIVYLEIAISGSTASDAQRSIEYFEQYVERYRAVYGAAPPDLKKVEYHVGALRAQFG